MRNFKYLEHALEKEVYIRVLVVEHKGKHIWMYSTTSARWRLLRNIHTKDKQPTNRETEALNRMYHAAAAQETLDKAGLIDSLVT